MSARVDSQGWVRHVGGGGIGYRTEPYFDRDVERIVKRVAERQREREQNG